MNLIDADSIEQLARLVTRIEDSPSVTVVVFDSANPDYFMAHWDLRADRARVAAMSPGPTGLHPFVDNLVRLSKVPAVTISAIRGRVRGRHSEFVLATDIRFASDKAILGQFDVGLEPGSVSSWPAHSSSTVSGCARQGRRVDTRSQLRTAYESLTAMGVDAFAERARRELAATGETVRKRSVETDSELTAQEAHIARLAAEGLTNPRSPPPSISAREPSNGTFARSSRSSESPPDGGFDALPRADTTP